MGQRYAPITVRISSPLGYKSPYLSAIDIRRFYIRPLFFFQSLLYQTSGFCFQTSVFLSVAFLSDLWLFFQTSGFSFRPLAIVTDLCSLAICFFSGAFFPAAVFLQIEYASFRCQKFAMFACFIV